MGTLGPVDASALLSSLAVLRHDVRRGELGRVAQGLAWLETAVASLLSAVETQVTALADANAAGVEHMIQMQDLVAATKTQNQALAAHAAEAERTRAELQQQIDAVADATVSAMMELSELSDSHDEVKTRAQTLAARGEVLEAEARALADANVESMIVAQDYETKLRDLGGRQRELEDSMQSLRHLAEHDALTGLFNRRYYDEHLRAEVARARRYGRKLSMLLLDVDRFKAFNDSNGHPDGDALLAEIGEILRSMIRTSDYVLAGPPSPDGAFVARYGGEEFVVVLPETPLEGAAILAERIRAKIDEHAFAISDQRGPDRVSVSIGVSELCAADQNIVDLAARADRGLYAAKREGRNRVVPVPAAELPSAEALAG